VPSASVIVQETKEFLSPTAEQSFLKNILQSVLVTINLEFPDTDNLSVKDAAKFACDFWSKSS
jgi:hypothetical protein